MTTSDTPTFINVEAVNEIRDAFEAARKQFVDLVEAVAVLTSVVATTTALSTEQPQASPWPTEPVVVFTEGLWQGSVAVRLDDGNYRVADPDGETFVLMKSIDVFPAWEPLRRSSGFLDHDPLDVVNEPRTQP